MPVGVAVYRRSIGCQWSERSNTIDSGVNEGGPRVNGLLHPPSLNRGLNFRVVDSSPIRPPPFREMSRATRRRAPPLPSSHAAPRQESPG